MDLPPLPRFIRAPETADPVELARTLCLRGHSDGLPVIPPSVPRVNDMLGGRDPKQAVGALPPLYRDLTAEDVAVCAVLAGCRPEVMPSLLAAVQAVQASRFNLLGVATTTGTVAVGMILHGPCAAVIGANSGANLLGPGNPTNATLGRALALVLRAGGMIQGAIDMSTMGQPAKFGMCFAEAEHPTFPSLRSRHGLSRDTCAVSVFAASGTIEVVDARSVHASGLMATLATALPVPGTVHAEGRWLGSGQPLVIIPPEWADRLHKDGVTLSQAQSLLFEQSLVPVDRLSPASADGLSSQVRVTGMVACAVDPDSIVLVVAGGVGTKATYIPTWHGGSSIVTVPVHDMPVHHPPISRSISPEDS